MGGSKLGDWASLWFRIGHMVFSLPVFGKSSIWFKLIVCVSRDLLFDVIVFQNKNIFFHLEMAHFYQKFNCFLNDKTFTFCKQQEFLRKVICIPIFSHLINPISAKTSAVNIEKNYLSIYKLTPNSVRNLYLFV